MGAGGGVSTAVPCSIGAETRSAPPGAPSAAPASPGGFLLMMSSLGRRGTNILSRTKPKNQQICEGESNPRSGCRSGLYGQRIPHEKQRNNEKNARAD